MPKIFAGLRGLTMIASTATFYAAWAISHGMVVVRNWNGFSKSGSAMSGFMYNQGNTYESCDHQAALNGTNIH